MAQQQYFGTAEAAAWVDGQSYTIHAEQRFPSESVPAKVLDELVRRGLLSTDAQSGAGIETATRRPGQRSAARAPR